MKKRISVSRTAWFCTNTYTKIITHNDRWLLLQVMEYGPNQFGMTALETSTKVKTPNDVFDDHGHHYEGIFLTLNAGKTAALNYAKKWLNERKAIKSCDCKEIDLAKPLSDVLIRP